MDKVNTLASKLRLLGEEAEILENDSVIVHKNLFEMVGYKIVNDNVIRCEYEIECMLRNSTRFICAKKDNNYYLLDRHLNPKLKFSGEQPMRLINNYFLVMFSKQFNSGRIIGLDGKEASGGLCAGIDSRRVNDNTIVCTSTYKNYREVVICSYIKGTTKRKVIHTVDIADQVYPGLESIAIRYKQKDKVIIYDYDSNVMLSIPGGRVKQEVDRYILYDKSGKKFREIYQCRI